MCLRRCVFPVLLLAGALFRVALCSFAGAETAGIDFYGAPDKGVAPLEVHFHYFGDEAVTQRITGWRWDFGDGAASTENYTTHEYANPGTYTVTLTVTFADGTTQTQTKEKCVTVTSGPAAESSPEEAEQGPPEASESPGERPAAEEARSGGDDVLFIHHSCGENWLNSGLHEALLAKDYVDERNDITYGVDMAPDAGRPDSLGPVPGDLTDMHHWILWFNDYFESVRRYGCRDGVNRIIIFKSCFPNSHIETGGSEPGDPFSDWKTLANYKAVHRHPEGAGHIYEHEGHTYRALADVFARHPDTLFIAVTAPPECRQETDNQIAANARAFNNWLKQEWLPGYTRETGLHNVGVFDWFDILAARPNAASHPNQLRAEYGGCTGDSHPNGPANAKSTQVFATDPENYLDRAWADFGRSRSSS